VLTITGLSGLTLSTVALSGTGMDFQLSGSGDGGSVPAQTVKSGTPASFNLSLEGLGGFTGTVNFTCSNAPTNGSCTVNPTSIAAGSSTSTIVVTVNTSTTTTAMLRRGGVWLAFACVFPAMFLATQKRRSMRRKMQLFLIALGLVVFSMTSCGGGGGGGGSTTPPPSSTTKLTPAGTYTVQVAASSGTTSKSINLQVVVQ
jgi:hypothetical protein